MTTHGTAGGPTVSIVIPVHNVAEVLDTCLESIVTQSHQDLEIILVDDGSTDSSPEKCYEWARRDSRITVLRTPNRGASAARNTGLSIASGSLLAFVDSDDVIASRFIEQLSGLLEHTGAQIAMCEFIPFSDGLPTFDTVSEPQTSVTSAKVALHSIVCVRPQWEVWGKLYRRDLWREVSFPEGLIHQDLAVIPLVFFHASLVVQTDAALYGYRNRSGSIMDSVRQLGLSTDLLIILDQNIRLAKSSSSSKAEYDEFLAGYVMHASKQLEKLHRSDFGKNDAYIRAYKHFASMHRQEVVNCSSMSRGYRLLWIVSSYSPYAFSMLFKAARSIKAHGWIRLRRRSEVAS